MGDETVDDDAVPRRTFLKLGATGGAIVALGTAGSALVPDLRRRGLLSLDGVFDAASMAFADSIYIEAFPTSPLILSPFEDPLPIPKALAPVPESVFSSWSSPPGPGIGQQTNADPNERHQLWSSDIGFPDPLVYLIELQVNTHSFTSSQVLPINSLGQPTRSFDAFGKTYPAGVVRTLPASTIYGFNGTFPGPMINAEYGRPALVRFENHLDENPQNLDRQDFGSPNWSFLTHLHNAHTAPESDGNPHYSMIAGPRSEGYRPGLWFDNLYLNWPAGGDDREKQSFFWFHDHTMDHPGANVYKGLVGLYPIYDPVADMGDENQGFRLPGVRKNNEDGSFDVDYDIPLAIFDCRLDDGVTTHQDFHDGMGEYPQARNPRKHPEWSQGPKSAASLGLTGNELQGQYRIPDGQQCMRFTQIATDGGLIPFTFERDSFELWPAKRREFIVDFTKYQDGTSTTKGDEIYLTNVMRMPDGRMWTNSSRSLPDPNYKVPVLKFVIGDDAPDNSVIPTALRPLPAVPSNWKTLLANRSIFEVKRGSIGGETEWLINGKPFDPAQVATSLRNPAGKSPLAQHKRGSYNLWEIRNGGGGWVHPMHLHMEEHRTLMRNGKVVPPADVGHPDDESKEDLVALDPGENVVVGRFFRDFVGPYVAHCHNLAHEDHAMMFGWEIVP